MIEKLDNQIRKPTSASAQNFPLNLRLDLNHFIGDAILLEGRYNAFSCENNDLLFAWRSMSGERLCVNTHVNTGYCIAWDSSGSRIIFLTAFIQKTPFRRKVKAKRVSVWRFLVETTNYAMWQVKCRIFLRTCLLWYRHPIDITAFWSLTPLYIYSFFVFFGMGWGVMAPMVTALTVDLFKGRIFGLTKEICDACSIMIHWSTDLNTLSAIVRIISTYTHSSVSVSIYVWWDFKIRTNI